MAGKTSCECRCEGRVEPLLSRCPVCRSFQRCNPHTAREKEEAEWAGNIPATFKKEPMFRWYTSFAVFMRVHVSSFFGSSTRLASIRMFSQSQTCRMAMFFGIVTGCFPCSILGSDVCSEFSKPLNDVLVSRVCCTHQRRLPVCKFQLKREQHFS